MRRTATLLLSLATLVALALAVPSGAANLGDRAAATAHPRAAAHGRTVEYWVGAVPLSWNVVPTGKDPMTGQTFDAAKTTMAAVIYRPFSANWASQLPSANQGLVGPTLRARAGDTMLIHFKNFDTANPHSMHFHGVHYEVASDGAYIPGVTGPGANVPPGGTFTYKLEPGDDSVGAWPYHDHSPSMMTSSTEP